MAEYDALELGKYYSEDYLKKSGHINNARSIGTIYDLVLTTDKSASDEDVLSLNKPSRAVADTSFVFRVVRHGENTQDIMIQDQSSAIVDRFLTLKLNDVTVASDISFNDRTATLSAGHGFVSGNMFEIDYNGMQYQSRVVNVATNVITLTNPFCCAIPAGTIGARVSPNANIDGSGAPVIFKTRPPAGVLWDLNILAINMLDQSPMDDAKFGGITGPINGVVFRTVNTVMAENIFTAVDNSCFLRHCDTENPYSDKAPAGYYGFNTKRRFNGQQGDGVARRIGGDYHEFQAVVSADIRALDRFWIVVRGHVVENGVYNN